MLRAAGPRSGCWRSCVLAQIEALGLELLEVRRLPYEPKRGSR